jgi:hypothetical protein
LRHYQLPPDAVNTEGHAMSQVATVLAQQTLQFDVPGTQNVTRVL